MILFGSRKMNGKEKGGQFQRLEEENMTLTEKEEISILPPPIEIMELLSALKENPELHKKRNTYNVWSPSPNRIENLRMVVQYICM